ncbi:MAG: alanine--glyoxylate aminotransferase family protein [Chloroflexi bacterium]|nr:alanine--glyoxylate aminotransferase family protein [Chloroflexota bacterium]
MSRTVNTDPGPTAKNLLGPGPSNVHPRVYKAMTSPVLSHMDPEFWEIMDETVELLREVFQTRNPLTLPLSGTGSAGMEAAIYNSLEPGDTIIVGVAGFFSSRIVEIAQRCDANVVSVKADWGQAIPPEAIEEELKRHPEAKVVALVHCETSTGVLQPLEEIGRLAHEHGAMFLVDSVASMGGHDLAVDSLGIDICYSGSQKCLSCPPGLAPITLSDTASQAMKARKSKPRSWYLDLSMLDEYWISARKYHHTAPASMIYALRESLRILTEEGLESSFARHHLNGEAMRAAVGAMGLDLVASEEVRSDTVHAILMPEGIDADQVRQTLLNDYKIETGGGLGPFKGKVIRIGLMGYSSQASNVLTVLSALEKILIKQGHEMPPSAGISAANRVYTEA